MADQANALCVHRRRLPQPVQLGLRVARRSADAPVVAAKNGDPPPGERVRKNEERPVAEDLLVPVLLAASRDQKHCGEWSPAIREGEGASQSDPSADGAIVKTIRSFAAPAVRGPGDLFEAWATV